MSSLEEPKALGFSGTDAPDYQNHEPRPLTNAMTSLHSAPSAQEALPPPPPPPPRDLAVPEAVAVPVRQRPSAEFEAVYREHFRFVWRCTKRLGIEGALVDDVVQETFLVVHRRLSEFEGRSSMKTWLYGIVRRVVSDHRRTLRRKPGLDALNAMNDAQGGDLEAVHDTSARGPEASLEQGEQLQLVRRLLLELDEEKREVFILTELEGMTMAEIAEALDVNPNTVSSRLRAARREFEEALERASEGSPR